MFQFIDSLVKSKLITVSLMAVLHGYRITTVVVLTFFMKEFPTQMTSINHHEILKLMRSFSLKLCEWTYLPISEATVIQ
jgi:hypothetical protein